MIKVDNLVDDEVIVSLSSYCEPNTPVNDCERGGAKRRRESIVNKNLKVAPPGLSSFRHP